MMIHHEYQNWSHQKICLVDLIKFASWPYHYHHHHRLISCVCVRKCFYTSLSSM